jgi:hypothetical protein
MAIGSVAERPVDFAGMGKEGGVGLPINRRRRRPSSSKSRFTQHA